MLKRLAVSLVVLAASTALWAQTPTPTVRLRATIESKRLESPCVIVVGNVLKGLAAVARSDPQDQQQA